MLKRMRIFDVTVPPDGVERLAANAFDAEDNVDVTMQFDMYLAARRRPDWKVRTDSYAFWLGHVGVYRALAPCALKALEFPMSSISAERVFAMARAIDLPRRRSQKRSTFCREVFLRANLEFTTRALHNALDTYQALP